MHHRFLRAVRRLAVTVGSAQNETLRRPGLWLGPGVVIVIALAGSGWLKFDNRPETWLETSSVQEGVAEAQGFYLLVRENIDAEASAFLAEDRELSKRLSVLPGVAVVESVSQILQRAGKSTVEELGDGARFLDGYLLFEKRQTAILRVWLTEGADVSEIGERIRAIPTASGLSLLGPSAFAAHIDEVSRREGARAIPIAIAAAFAVQALAFRSLRVAVVSTLASLLRVLVCIGVFGWAGVAFNFLTVNVPILAFVISVALEIHPLWEWRRLQRRVGGDRAVSLRGVAARTFPGCFLSAVTTTIGFGSLVLAEFGAVREFGLLTATAIAIVFGCGVLMFPVVVRLVDRRETAASPSWVFPALARVTTRHPLQVSSVSLLLILGAATQIVHLDVNHDSLGFFSRDDEFRTECERVRSKVGGLAPLEVLVSFPETRPTAERLRMLDGVVQGLETSCGARAVSILDPLKLGVSLLANGAPGSFALPASDASLEVAHRLATALPDVRSRFIKDDGRTFRVFLSVDVFSNADLEAVLSRVATVSARFPTVQTHPTGLVYELMDMQAAILHEQIASLGIVAACVAALVGVYFGSVVHAFLAVLVNLAPVLVVGALVVLAGLSLDLTTAMVAGVALGISVDDTIHLLWEYRRTVRRADDGRIRLVLARVGPPIVVTTFIIVAGFFALAAARFPPIARLGWLVGGSLALSLPFQLVTLPSLLELRRRRRPRGKTWTTPVRIGSGGLWGAGLFWGAFTWNLAACQSPDRIAAVDRSTSPRVEAPLEPAWLDDQYGHRWSTEEILSGPTVLILTSRETADQGTEWDNDVVAGRRHGSSIPVHRILDLRPIPALVASYVKARIRKNTRPPGTPVLLDWKGDVARRFSAAGGLATVLVVDSAGDVVFRAEGRPTPETARAFSEAVEDVEHRVRAQPSSRCFRVFARKRAPQSLEVVRKKSVCESEEDDEAQDSVEEGAGKYGQETPDASRRASMKNG